MRPSRIRGMKGQPSWPITPDRVASLLRSAHSSVRRRDVAWPQAHGRLRNTGLDMRDGSDYTELYPDFTTTFRLQDCAIGWTEADYCPENGPRGLRDFLPSIGRDESKAGKFSCRSGSTNVIGWVLERATGKPLAELISTYVWQPMGAEFDADITVDIGGSALADHGMSSTLRDLGRVGLLVLNDGSAFGKPSHPGRVHRRPTRGTRSRKPNRNRGILALDYTPYYRSFWWGDGNTERDLTGLGIHGQILRVAPEAGSRSRDSSPLGHAPTVTARRNSGSQPLDWCRRTG